MSDAFQARATRASTKPEDGLGQSAGIAIADSITNPDAYQSVGAPFVLVVHAHRDMVPGAWHEPRDLMNWIASHSYVEKVELLEGDSDD